MASRRVDMQKISCTKITLVNAFLGKAFARGMRGKTKPLSAWVIEEVHPDSTFSWNLMASEVENHQCLEMALLI